jgi:hypothetical protein
MGLSRRHDRGGVSRRRSWPGDSIVSLDFSSGRFALHIRGAYFPNHFRRESYSQAENTLPASQNCLAPRDLKKKVRGGHLVAIDKFSPFHKRYVFCLISTQSESYGIRQGSFRFWQSKFSFTGG